MRRFVWLGTGLLALSACSGEPRAADAKRDRDAAEVSAPATTPPGAKEVEAVSNANAAAPASVVATAQAARRCGWLHNPTPANWWLVDRDGEWILGTQGGAQAAGLDEMPDMSALDWQEINGHYGYGCACMTLTVDPATRRVERVADAAPKPLAICRADKALPSQ